jgi:hypothetical protein
MTLAQRTLRLIFTGLLLLLLASPAAASPAPTASGVLTPDPRIQEMIDQVSSTTLYNYVGGLTGETPVIVGGEPYTITTRFSLSDIPIAKATQYAYEHFQSLGLTASYFDYYLQGFTRRNVIAEQIGLTQPGRIVLAAAHLDSTSELPYPSTLAPGADDNASGSAGVLVAADILSQYSFGCTLRYALFTGEEQGLYGSAAYAAAVHTLGEDVAGVVNLDMIAYNTAGTAPTMELHTRHGNAGDLLLANLYSDVIAAYQIDLTPVVLQDGESASDHYSFWQKGYPAILAIEDWSDHTPFYHKTADRLQTLDMAYYTRFVKAAVGTLAHLGCLPIPNPPPANIYLPVVIESGQLGH